MSYRCVSQYAEHAWSETVPVTWALWCEGRIPARRNRPKAVLTTPQNSRLFWPNPVSALRQPRYGVHQWSPGCYLNWSLNADGVERTTFENARAKFEGSE